MLITGKRQTKNMIPIESKERTEMVKYEMWLLTHDGAMHVRCLLKNIFFELF